MTTDTPELSEAEIAERAKKIAALNDDHRKTLRTATLSAGIAALPPHEQANLFTQIRGFTAFDKENDPYGEHDSGTVMHADKMVMWKFDYYSRDVQGQPDYDYGSDDPTDPTKTTRVLTILFMDEY